MKKPVSKCKVKSGNVRLNDDEPYSTFSAQLLVVITSTLKPRLEGLHQYKICCIISNVLPKPGMLISSEEDYTIMVATALKSKGPHIINITVEELDEDDGVDKENEESQSGEWGKKGSKKMVCICRYLMTSFSWNSAPQQPPVYPANNEKVENCWKLYEWWTCMKQACPSTFCFVNPNTETHIPLGHDHFDGWSLAMVHMIYNCVNCNIKLTVILIYRWIWMDPWPSNSPPTTNFLTPLISHTCHQL